MCKEPTCHLGGGGRPSPDMLLSAAAVAQIVRHAPLVPEALVMPRLVRPGGGTLCAPARFVPAAAIWVDSRDRPGGDSAQAARA